MASNIISFDGFPEEIRMTEDGRYSVLDVIKFCGKKNPRTTLARLFKQYPQADKEISSHKFPGRGQQFTSVAEIEVIEKILFLLQIHPSREQITSDKYYPRTEEQIISVLVKAFSDCEPCFQFYCRGYRIDLYLAKYRIAIECDEYNHSNYKERDEKKREQLIKESLGCSFIRFNPYDPSFNIGSVILEIRQLLGE